MNCLADRRLIGPLVRGIALLGVLGPSLALAAPPKIARLSVHGLQTGAATRVVVQGSGLLPEPKLLLDLPNVSQTVQGTPRADSVEFEVTLDKSAVPGVYNLRLSNANGITAAEIVAVDHLPQRPVAAAASPAEMLPVAIHGAVSGATVQETRFTGHAGEQITLDALARRFGSKLRPVMHLYDSQRRQIAWCLPLTSLAGDARLQVQLPADDTYIVAIHDLAYAAAAPGHYRLAIGDFDYVDQVYPPVISRTSSAPLEMIGKFGSQRTAQFDATAVGQSLQESADGALCDWRPLAWPNAAGPIGLRPRVQLSNLTELVEGLTLDSSRQLPMPPVAVSGFLGQAGEEDVYHLDVAETDKLRFEVFADRLGSPLDATLELKNPQGARLVFNDDAVGADPRLDYTVPKGVTRVMAVVADAHRRGDPGCVYRLVVTRVDNAHLDADFKLGVLEDTYQIPGNGSKAFRVEAERFNYDGPIRLTVEGLPPGFTSPVVEIPAGANGALIEIRRAADPVAASSTGSPTSEPGLASSGRIIVRGRSVDKVPEISRAAEIANHPLANLQPWLKYDLAVAATIAPQPFDVSWNHESPESPLFLGIDGKLALRFHRGPGAIGPLRLLLVTSQVPVLVNGQVNPALLVRGSAATIDIPVDPKVKAAFDAVTAAEKTLADSSAKLPKTGDPDPKLVEAVAAATAKRDEAAGQLTEAESKINAAYEYVVLVPTELRAGQYDLAIRADLRSMDNATSLTEAFTAPRRFDIEAPIELADAGGADPSVVLDPKLGATVTLAGTVKRLAGFAGDVTLTLAGLPAGIAVPRVVLKPTEEKYQLEFKLPATFAADRIDAVQLSVTLAPDARRTNILTKVERPVPAIRVERPAVVADSPPAADKPPAAAQPPAIK